MAVVGESFTIDAVSLDLLWERLALGAFPLVLQLRVHGDSFDERHAMFDVARRRLHEDGLLNGTAVHPLLERWLQVLGRPEDELDLRWRDGTEELRATVVRRGEVTVRVVKRGDELTFTPVTPGSMPSAVVDVLPEVRAAGQGQLSAPTEQLAAAYKAAATSVPAATVALLQLGASRPDATAVATALNTSVAVAQIGAARTSNRRRVRHPSVVAVLDTGHGRYVSTERAAPDHRLWSTVRPASQAAVVRAAAELLADVRADGAKASSPVLRL